MEKSLKAAEERIFELESNMAHFIQEFE